MVPFRKWSDLCDLPVIMSNWLYFKPIILLNWFRPLICINLLEERKPFWLNKLVKNLWKVVKLLKLLFSYDKFNDTFNPFWVYPKNIFVIQQEMLKYNFRLFGIAYVTALIWPTTAAIIFQWAFEKNIQRFAKHDSWVDRRCLLRKKYKEIFSFFLDGVKIRSSLFYYCIALLCHIMTSRHILNMLEYTHRPTIVVSLKVSVIFGRFQ
jgi:hypothetical protein